MDSQAVKIVDGGKLIIPTQFRRKLGIKTGDTVLVELADDGLHVRALSGSIKLAQNIVREFARSDVSLADDWSWTAGERRAVSESCVLDAAAVPSLLKGEVRADRVIDALPQRRESGRCSVSRLTTGRVWADLPNILDVSVEVLR